MIRRIDTISFIGQNSRIRRRMHVLQGVFFEEQDPAHSGLKCRVSAAATSRSARSMGSRRRVRRRRLRAACRQSIHNWRTHTGNRSPRWAEPRPLKARPPCVFGPEDPSSLEVLQAAREDLRRRASTARRPAPETGALELYCRRGLNSRCSGAEPTRRSSCPASALARLTSQPTIANDIAPMPPGLPRRSMISPSASRLASMASPNFLSTLTRSKNALSDT